MKKSTVLHLHITFYNSLAPYSQLYRYSAHATFKHFSRVKPPSAWGKSVRRMTRQSSELECYVTWEGLKSEVHFSLCAWGNGTDGSVSLSLLKCCPEASSFCLTNWAPGPDLFIDAKHACLQIEAHLAVPLYIYAVCVRQNWHPFITALT